MDAFKLFGEEGHIGSQASTADAAVGITTAAPRDGDDAAPSGTISGSWGGFRAAVDVPNQAKASVDVDADDEETYDTATKASTAPVNCLKLRVHGGDGSSADALGIPVTVPSGGVTAPMTGDTSWQGALSSGEKGGSDRLGNRRGLLDLPLVSFPLPLDRTLDQVQINTGYVQVQVDKAQGSGCVVIPGIGRFGWQGGC
ncbi:hypothetical protein VOLCADRAFT_95796 [Volvox carteri f. nagariensis]|uniref:Uncharacterized protein n=1 Tax=Volvox carteri f. nagariensis TaxID=3068 RepID=D8U8E7_VOLCA|nr:uncharacterized protein VOLCADRAFT_95796 [Volvox carteri f. nagariensis]EFJ43914.1 hypothetical protein VOLCADRAFT_95796 [Volvox carteri f. nagariensis]|eukprot:XP_002954926.1 hypothetical protein VOLCADRAFT_95796 [Volvox carteri f. nagariensis]